MEENKTIKLWKGANTFLISVSQGGEITHTRTHTLHTHTITLHGALPTDDDGLVLHVNLQVRVRVPIVTSQRHSLQ